jgi:hypothetical protein
MMRTSVRSLLTGAIDYAGLFPPARLPLDEAFAAFLEHRREPAGWLIGRFVCPAARLDELTDLAADLDELEAPIVVSVLGTAGDEPEDFLTAVASDAAAIGRATTIQPERLLVDQYEVRTPTACPAERLPEILRSARERLEGASPTGLVAFFETPLLGGWRGSLSPAVAAVASAGSGLKIRCGGPDASAVPGAAAVAAALAASARLGVPLKATQGLHHPLRHFDRTLETTVHGFLNLLIAGVLARSRRLDEETFLELVEEEDLARYRFTDDGLAWRDFAADLGEIASARQHVVTTFGSCSFTEPRDDLVAMGLFEG